MHHLGTSCHIPTQHSLFELHARCIFALPSHPKILIQLMRPYVACCALKAHFEDCLRNDTGTPVWLELHVVTKWIAEQKKAEKEKRQMMRAAGKAGRSSEKKSKKPAERGTEDEESGDMKESDDSDDTDDDEAGH